MSQYPVLIADVAPNLPVTISSGVNDTFVYTPTSTGIPETFTLFAGTYTSIAQATSNFANAQGESSETFASALAGPGDTNFDHTGSNQIQVTILEYTCLHNGDAISEGNGGAAALGFTGSPDTFQGGYGLNFTPPLVKVVPPYGPDSTQAQYDLWRHFENRYRGVNVWILSDGSVVQSDPTPENSNVDMSNILPGDSLLGNQPYVTSIFIDPGANPQVPTIHTVSHDPYVVAKFYGGRTYVVTEAQQAILVGYTAHGNGYVDCFC